MPDTSTNMMKTIQENSETLDRIVELLSPAESDEYDPIQKLLDRQNRIENLLIDLIEVIEDISHA